MAAYGSPKSALHRCPRRERSSDGWYEEDCEAAWPLRRFRNEVLHAFPADRLDRYIDANISFSGGSFASIAMNRKA